MSKKWLPHPPLSFLLLAFWLWLNNTLAPGHWLLGAVLAIAIPLLSTRFWPDPQRIPRPLLLVRYLLLLLGDIVVANIEVARLVLGPRSRLRPGFAIVPLDLTSDAAITALASSVTLTPGTVSVEVTPDRRALVVHFLCHEDPEALVREIKARYEAPLKEIFGC